MSENEPMFRAVCPLVGGPYDGDVAEVGLGPIIDGVNDTTICRFKGNHFYQLDRINWRWEYIGKHNVSAAFFGGRDDPLPE